jgi:hypothetical protein
MPYSRQAADKEYFLLPISLLMPQQRLFYLRLTLLNHIDITLPFSKLYISDANMIFQKRDDAQRNIIKYFPDALFIHF